MNTQEFINRSKLIFGESVFDYSKTKYFKYKEKLVITCKIHKDFKVTPNKHLSRKQGCPDCSKENRKKLKTMSVEQFIEKAIKKWNNFYNYSKVRYINCNTLVTINCPCHGDFKLKPSAHLFKTGCPSCSIEKLKKMYTSNTQEFINKSKLIHGDYYDYSLVNYINSKTKINIICKLHGLFEQTPAHHLQGQGCPFCNNTGGYNDFFFKSKPEMKDIPAKLYFYRFWNDNEEFYKIGITISNKRYFNSNYQTSIISEINTTLYNGWLKEQKFLNDFKKYKYTPKIKFNGHTECFESKIYKIMFN